MGEDSKIEWTHHTFNIVEGCQKVSPACANCYAERRDNWIHSGQHWGPNAPRKLMSEAYWRQPLKWNRDAQAAGERRRVFCSSLADVFEDHPTVEQERAKLWRLIDETPMLDWLLLTKRPENIARMIFKTPWNWCPECGIRWDGTDEYERERLFYLDDEEDEWKCRKCSGLVSWNRSNLWLGTTAENQEWADKRIPVLLAVPAVVHFISAEPLLGPLDLSAYLHDVSTFNDIAWDMLDWVIVGGESGPNARPMHPGWARSIQQQCEAAKVPFLFKQWGCWRPVSEMNELEMDAMYYPLQEGAVSDSTRKEKHKSLVLQLDGTSGDSYPPGAMLMFNMDKHDAGRLLDGRTWDEFPASEQANSAA